MEAQIRSASWGTDGAVDCPTGEQGLDHIPVTFSWFISRSSIETTDVEIVRSDGSIATPTCGPPVPARRSDEAQTANLIGDFGDSVQGPMPVVMRVIGSLEGAPPGTTPWSPLPPLIRTAIPTTRSSSGRSIRRLRPATLRSLRGRPSLQRASWAPRFTG